MERVLLTREPIDSGQAVSALRRFDAGAVVTFIGTVRAEAHCGKQLLALEYEAYEEMALEQLRVIRQKAVEKFAVLDVAVTHRLGRMTLGEASVCITVAAGHRAEAFEACRWIMDMIKTDVPIWKKDVWSDGTTQWAGAQE